MEEFDPIFTTTNYLIVSMGDPAGIGWSLLKKIIMRQSDYFRKTESEKIKDLIVVGDFFESEKNEVQKLFHVEKFPKEQEQIFAILQNKKRKKPLFLFLQQSKSYELGKPNAALALRSYLYFQKAMQLWLSLPVASLITLPVSKELIIRSGVDFSGHTEILQDTTGNKAVMCMYHPTLSVIPLTQHIPLSQVPTEILHVDFFALTNALQFFSALLGIKKSIAIAGLNPHAGENGKIGNEEKFLSKKIEKLKKKNFTVQGPLPADGLFSPSVRKDFSLIITNYHDQGLIPFKALFGTKGLNITLNLPRLRVSPDHGTAYDRAAQQSADETGVLNSLRFAMKWGKKWMQVYSSIF